MLPGSLLKFARDNTNVKVLFMSPLANHIDLKKRKVMLSLLHGCVDLRYASLKAARPGVP
jgi:hypothetical protein